MSRWFREAALWAGAALGVLAMVGAVAVIGFGYTFLIFRSGSMAPEIPTGSIAVARTVDADRIAKGDVVSVEAASGTRVTHRVVQADKSGSEVQLTLKGDANKAPDDETYAVSNADRVIASVPVAGYVVAWLLSAPGLLVAGGFGALLVLLGLRSDRDDRPRGSPQRRRDMAAIRRRTGRGRASMAMVASAAVVVSGVTLTDAYFTDDATATTTAGSAKYFTCANALATSANGGLAPWAWYKMNETTGTAVADSSGNNIAATWRNSTGLSRGQTRSCGRDTGTSIALNGTSNYASTADISTAQGTAGARWNTFTISLWFKSATAASTGKLIGMGNVQANNALTGAASTSYDRHIILNTAGNLVFGVYPNDYREVTAAGDYSDQQWHLVTASLSTAGMKLYVDGQPAGTWLSGTTTGQQYTPMYWRLGQDTIGTTWAGGPAITYFAGQMDEVGIWTRALSDTEVLNLYRSGEPNP